ncbi:MAG: virulence RhuM family protein [Alphaproteobacteria bacterium]|nr:virulence RhuM family protein [Alphaproteobacteria bacterium]
MKSKSIQKQELIIYTTEDGRTRVEVRLSGDSIWLSQAQMADLFQTTKQNISLHIQNIIEEHELFEAATVKDFLTVQKEGKRDVSRNITYYNLDMVIAVGYRVKSPIGTQFRRWATEILSEYARKGFAMNDSLLKAAGGGGYWKELLARIRDIRSSERVFYLQILEIYATSMDYDPNASETLAFFKMMQNKMHFAAHGHTAAELQYTRADASKPFMGLTSWTGDKPRKSDVTVAKNYLHLKELDTLNKITTAYLEFAEMQATNEIPMRMKDWITKLDEFLKLGGKALLTHAGQISKEAADEKAVSEYTKYQAILPDTELSDIEKRYLENLKYAQKKLESTEYRIKKETDRL